MAISVKVPKKLSKIKTKVMFNLTKRQLVCFGGAALVGFPVFFALRKTAGTDVSALVMVALMLPFFFFAIYEKNGFPAEQALWIIWRQKRVRPGIRVYKSENFYLFLDDKGNEELDIRKEKPNRKDTGQSEMMAHQSEKYRALESRGKEGADIREKETGRKRSGADAKEAEEGA